MTDRHEKQSPATIADQLESSARNVDQVTRARSNDIVRFFENPDEEMSSAEFNREYLSAVDTRLTSLKEFISNQTNKEAFKLYFPYFAARAAGIQASGAEFFTRGISDPQFSTALSELTIILTSLTDIAANAAIDMCDSKARENLGSAYQTQDKKEKSAVLALRYVYFQLLTIYRESFSTPQPQIAD